MITTILTLACMLSVLGTSAMADGGLANYIKQNQEANDTGVRVKGPSLHLAGGARMKKSPDMDQFEYGVVGLKISLLNIFFGSQTYLSLAAPGIDYVGKENRLAFSFTPVIFNHISGLGLGVDMFAMRSDRSGGPIGFSLNLDVLQLASFASGFMK